ncbi:peptidase A22B, signal peptide peptidase [Crucibulum laeve]|uniref:Peptidase A22B, signal peptide peptidase n=1 Tax=Crucibulum laeve TaxID=68775 RepID=A0A5C3MH26_9AGAR|nr:peptidase A22B, signal peptide peptidase [Crucibulum laeve]
MSSDDAWLFPIIGSVALGGLYIIVKYFGKEWINWVLGWYFALAGIGSVWKSSISLTRFFLGDVRWKKFEMVRFTVKKGTASLLSVSMRTPSVFLFPLAIIPSALYTFYSASRKSVLLTDILGLSFSHNALSLLKIDSFKTGSILLSGLFFYDIWWVFGTEVMVKVATSLDVPIKLLWPKSITFAASRGYTMLGLGDIVIPGTLVALALRYDYHRFTSGAQKDGFRKPYFYASLSAYVLGLLTTMTVMHTFGKAQPALLYLSPACILSFVITGSIRGELRDVWNWSDDPEVAADASAEKKRASGVILEDNLSTVKISVEEKDGESEKQEALVGKQKAK